MARVHHFGDDGHAEPLAGGLEDFQAVLAHALETIGAGSGLEGSASEYVCPGVPDLLGDLDEDGFPLDRARAGNHHQVASADLDALDLEL